VVVDLSACSWLNSLELGVVARMAREARRGGRRLFLSGVAGRVRRLVRLFRLERYVEAPDSPASWSRRLQELTAPRAARGTRWVLEGGALLVLLPEEFEREEAWQARDEFMRRDTEGAAHRVVIDGHRLRYIDTSGLWFVRIVWLATQRRPEGGLVLR